MSLQSLRTAFRLTSGAILAAGAVFWAGLLIEEDLHGFTLIVRVNVIGEAWGETVIALFALCYLPFLIRDLTASKADENKV